MLNDYDRYAINVFYEDDGLRILIGVEGMVGNWLPAGDTELFKSRQAMN